MINFIRKTVLWIVLLPFALTFIGAASNQAVLIANHDRFPVLLNDIKLKNLPTVELTDGTIMLDDTHCLMTDRTRLNFLADVFDKGSIESIGDLLMQLGDYSFSYSLVIWSVIVIQKIRKNEL